MLCSYHDIISRIPDPPLWWDENGVPRYVAFAPREAANIYANEVALVAIACQSCGTEFKVAFSWGALEWRAGVPSKREPHTVDSISRIHYGDPPNACCHAGATMNCEDLRVLEFWRESKNHWDFERVPELEVTITEERP